MRQGAGNRQGEDIPAAAEELDTVHKVHAHHGQREQSERRLNAMFCCSGIKNSGLLLQLRCNRKES